MVARERCWYMMWAMRGSGHLGRKMWQWFRTPPTTATLWKRAAVSLWLTPPIVLFPLLLPLLEPSTIPSVLIEFWQIYLLFFALPFALGIFCWRRSVRAARM
jgi:hypothetical protein